MFHRKKVSPDSKTEKPILPGTEKTNKRFYSDHSIHLSMITTFMVQELFFSHRVLTLYGELILSANKTFVADEILTCQTVKCPENTYLGSTYVILSVLNGQLKNKWLQAKTVTLTFSAYWIVRGYFLL